MAKNLMMKTENTTENLLQKGFENQELLLKLNQIIHPAVKFILRIG